MLLKSRGRETHTRFLWDSSTLHVLIHASLTEGVGRARTRSLRKSSALLLIILRLGFDSLCLDPWTTLDLEIMCVVRKGQTQVPDYTRTWQKDLPWASLDWEEHRIHYYFEGWQRRVIAETSGTAEAKRDLLRAGLDMLDHEKKGYFAYGNADFFFDELYIWVYS